GFPAGSIVLLEGGNGAGKSAISQRLVFGMIENETSVTYVSTQLTTKGFIQQMYSIDYPIATHLLKGSLLYIPVIPLMQSAKKRIDFLQRLMSAEQLFENDVIVIDTLSALIKSSADSEKVLDLISFFKKISGMGKIIIITLDSDHLSEDITQTLHSSADVYLTLKTKAVASEIKRTIIVNKFTGAKGTVAQVIGFRIEPNVGLVVEISAVA
ncbi:MAG: ATPase, partial [Methanosarcinales archaeon]|nr:ATPase [Methanosarcinales archaeon]